MEPYDVPVDDKLFLGAVDSATALDADALGLRQVRNIRNIRNGVDIIAVFGMGIRNTKAAIRNISVMRNVCRNRIAIDFTSFFRCCFACFACFPLVSRGGRIAPPGVYVRAESDAAPYGRQTICASGPMANKNSSMWGPSRGFV